MIEELQRFREHIAIHQDPIYEYVTFPRMGLVNKVAITTLLPPDLRSLHIKVMAKNLMILNSDVLRGGVRPIKQKIFKDTDRDRSGNSLAGARLVQLEGTREFVSSLAKLLWNYRFKLGISTITIRSVGRFPPGPNSSGAGRGRGRRGQSGFPPLGRGGGLGRGFNGPRTSAGNNNNNNNNRNEHQQDGRADGGERDQQQMHQDDEEMDLADEARQTFLNATSGQTVTEIVDNIRGNSRRSEGGEGSGRTGIAPGAPEAPASGD
jgi:hypothetical protein